jgi:peroxiredoxin
MKKYLLIATLAAIIISGCKHEKLPEYTINGTITGADTGWVLLMTRNGQQMNTTDSAAINQGKFEIKGSVIMPGMYYLTLKGRQDQFGFFLENSVLNVTLYPDSIKSSVVAGSKTQDLYMTYKAKEKGFGKLLDEQYNNYQKASESNDTAGVRRAEHNYDSIQELLTSFQKDFILKNGKSVVAPYLVMRMPYMFNLQELENIETTIDTSLNRSDYVKELKKRIEILKAVQPGMTAPEFTMNDTIGKPVSLNSFRGKILLVDFWASWCGPCRHENPNVVAAYNEFKDKGFDVLGVSLDNEKEKWMEAIHKDKLTWTHVSDLKGWQNSSAALYGVMSIPSNFLIDKDGKIIVSDLRGEDLKAKLKELLMPQNN